MDNKFRQKVLYILAPSDRFNYGDLIFPHILKYYFENDFDKIIYCSTSKSNLSIYGGIPTYSSSKLYKAKSKDDNTLIVAGGDSLFINWTTILSFIDPAINIMSAIDHKIGKHFFLNNYIKYFYKPRTKFPFTVGTNELPTIKKVIYNSLGGTCLENDCTILKNTSNKNILKHVNYISTRDNKTSEILASNGFANHVVPDTAIMMDDVFDEKKIERNITKLTAAVTPNSYVFFQIGKNYANGHETFYANLIDNLYLKYKVKFCLCPIGLALGHSDDKALFSIARQLKFAKYYLIKQPTIYDIMYLIKNASLYIGTSLHGTITSISFKTPFVVHGPSKLRNYLETWHKDTIQYFVKDYLLEQTIIEQLEHPYITSSSTSKDIVLQSFSRIRKIAQS